MYVHLSSHIYVCAYILRKGVSVLLSSEINELNCSSQFY